jgi:blocked-early-in-transport protein 1
MSTSRFSAKAHQRDRQSLFTADQISRSQSASPLPNTSNISISSNPYERSRLPNYSTKAAEMALLESQSEDTVNEMKYKIGALKDLSLAMGDQINKSKDTIVELGEDMGLSSEKIKNNMNRMRRFVERSGVGWKVWAGFTVILMWLFIWVWLF